MSGQLIFEVRQRSAVDPLETREIGFFTDDMLGANAVRALYQKAWSLVVKPSFLGSDYFPMGYGETISGKGFDNWLSDELNSTGPLFYIVPHHLYNKVPTVSEVLMFDTDTYLISVDKVVSG